MASVASTTIASGGGTGVTITKPTGLAVGDLLVAVLSSGSDDSTTGSDVWDTKSGWTDVATNRYFSRLALSIQYKFAEAGDVAASDFTFTKTGSTFFITRGSLLRCLGTVPSPLSPVGVTDTTNVSSSSLTLSGSLTPYTPNADNSIVIFQSAFYGNSVNGIGSYNTVASGITFTELYDLRGSSSLSPRSSFAYGVQATAAELSEYSAVASLGAITLHAAQFLVLVSPSDAAVANTLVTTNSSDFTQPTFAEATTQNNLTTTTTETFTQTGIGTSPTQWTNEAKPSTTWVNETK